MIVRDVIAAVLGNFPLTLFVIAVIVAPAKLRRATARREVKSVSFTLWGEIVFYCIGIGFIYAGSLHAYAQDFVAPLIGWQPSPFEFELGWAEIGLGVVALMSLWRGYEMRLAATLIFSIFSFAAAAQHIHLMLVEHNYAPGNAGTILWFGDIALPIILLVLAWAARDAYERTARRLGI